ncbi:MAG: family 43 glycosylhydrolase [Eubacteriales bacterium]|nr:family 43 glycosylhydrolase [Eubacteriales bacterium]
MEYYCNPINVTYRYQFNRDVYGSGEIQVAREAADPSMITFQGTYYIFASMTLGVWSSDDMVHWDYHRLPDNLPLYDYAPDVRVIGDYVYFSASKRGEPCDFYRTKDVVNGPYEKIEGTFDFWDPNLFVDEDGRVYFYWGCSNNTPIYGVEMNPETMRPLGEPKGLIEGKPYTQGYERVGEDNAILPLQGEELEEAFQDFVRRAGGKLEEIPKELQGMMKSFVSKAPFIEGAWMDKFQGKYYLQYAFSGAEYNVYGDGVYVSDSPLGPFTLAENNPYSYKPGGFLPGAGHGSTMQDKNGNLWHAATMRISVNHSMERRVGLWPAGMDADGELFCNQRYGDWPCAVEQAEMDPWRDPEWYLLSYGKTVTASSMEEGKGPELAVNENVQNWWRAADCKPGEWLLLDLGKVYDVHAVQVNFADDHIDIPVPGEIVEITQPRYIEEHPHVTRFTVEGSADGETYRMLWDQSETETDLPHSLKVWESGEQVRFLKLTILEIPYGLNPCISGFRVFGKGDGAKPEAPEFTAVRTNGIDMEVDIAPTDAMGYNILWGSAPEKLYHSYLLFGTKQRVGALVEGREYYVRVDAFNENGITEGTVKKL